MEELNENESIMWAKELFQFDSSAQTIERMVNETNDMLSKRCENKRYKTIASI